MESKSGCSLDLRNSKVESSVTHHQNHLKATLPRIVTFKLKHHRYIHKLLNVGKPWFIQRLGVLYDGAEELGGDQEEQNSQAH